MILGWWLTRLPSLEALPLHNDEGLHLTRAVEVWNGHPFWEIRDGKIVNHFVIAAFYPQNAPVFVGRIATLFVSVIGLAAGYALIRRHFGGWAAALAGLFWIASPYLLFFERLAFSDAEAGALVVVALWASDRLARSGKMRDAVLTGLSIGMAALFKFTAIPFAVSVVVVVLLMARHPLMKRLRLLIVAGLVTAALFVVPISYLLLRGSDLFSIALGWIGSGGAGSFALTANLARLQDTLIGFSLPAAALLIVGLMTAIIAPLIRRGVNGQSVPVIWIFMIALMIPLGVMVVFGREVLPRHFVVALPLALILAGAGFGSFFDRLTPTTTPNPRRIPADTPTKRTIRRTGRYAIVVGLLLMPFMLTLRTQHEQQADQPLPDIERHQFIVDHSAGYGLREAVLAFPQTIPQRQSMIIGSMFPDSCRRANFYAVNGYEMVCTNAPGTQAIIDALEDHRVVYVLVESIGMIGADMLALAESGLWYATRIASYARPGESLDQPSVTLWRISPQIR